MALLQRGLLAQVGTPEDLYLRPRSRFVAAFVGRATFVEGVQLADGRVQIGDTRFRGQGVCWPVQATADLEPGTKVEIAFRPEALSLGPPDEDGALAGEVVERRFTGETTLYLVNLSTGDSVLVKGELDGPATSGAVSVALRPSGPRPRSYALLDSGEDE